MHKGRLGTLAIDSYGRLVTRPIRGRASRARSNRARCERWCSWSWLAGPSSASRSGCWAA